MKHNPHPAAQSLSSYFSSPSSVSSVSDNGFDPFEEDWDSSESSGTSPYISPAHSLSRSDSRNSMMLGDDFRPSSNRSTPRGSLRHVGPSVLELANWRLGQQFKDLQHKDNQLGDLIAKLEVQREIVLAEIKRRCSQDNTKLLLSVFLVDGTHKKISVPTDTTGLELLYLTAEKIELTAPEYFSLCEVTKSGLGK
jgi:hypothetical protein